MKLIKFAPIILSVYLLPLKVYSATAFEPFLGTQLNSQLEDDTDTNTITGTFYGVKLGMEESKYALGLDYRTGTLPVEDYDNDLSIESLDLYLSLILSANFRLWFQYNLQNSMYVDNDSKLHYLADSQTLYGLGFSLSSNVRLNLEYTKTDIPKTKTGQNESDSDLSYQFMTLSLSFPLTL